MRIQNALNRNVIPDSPCRIIRTLYRVQISPVHLVNPAQRFRETHQRTKMPTIFQPPPLDESKAPVENVLELTPVTDFGPVCLNTPTYLPTYLCNNADKPYIHHLLTNRTFSPTQDHYGTHRARGESSAVPQSPSPYQQPCEQSRPNSPCIACTATSCWRGIRKCRFCTTWSGCARGAVS